MEYPDNNMNNYQNFLQKRYGKIDRFIPANIYSTDVGNLFCREKVDTDIYTSESYLRDCR